MINIHLLVEEDYIEELMMNLPKDKVKVVEKDFEENKVLLNDALNEYRNTPDSFISYKDSLENISLWINEGNK